MAKFHQIWSHCTESKKTDAKVHFGLKMILFPVSVPPTLLLDPSNQKIVVRSGTTVALRCKATGNPAPKITWRKRNDRLPAGEISDGGTTFSMTEVNWHHTGSYECEADNGVGPSVKAEIKLQILCKLNNSGSRTRPEIEFDETYFFFSFHFARIVFVSKWRRFSVRFCRQCDQMVNKQLPNFSKYCQKLAKSFSHESCIILNSPKIYQNILAAFLTTFVTK